MPSSYTTSLRLTLPATGELSGQWGNTVNTGITELLDASIAGTAAISTWGGAGIAYTLSNNSGLADEARKMFIVATGSPGEAKNVICPAVSKFYVFRNDTTGGFALTLKTSGGTGIAVPAGQYKFLYCDGTNVVEMFNSAGALTLSGALSVGGTATFASNPTFSAGTANGVLYLNGSKVATSGTALAFNGTSTFELSINQNASTIISTSNTTSGTAAYAAYKLASDTNTWLYNFSSGYTTSGRFAAGTTLLDANGTGGLSLNAQNGPISFWLSTEQMRLTSTGLGIGTSSPGYKLSVVGTAGSAVLNLLETGVRSWGIRAGGAVTNTFDIADFTAGQTRLTIDASGNLGIGTSSPGYRVDASGQVRALESGTGSGDGGFVASTAGANGNAGVLFQTNSASRWNLTTAGTNGANLRIYNYALASTIATFDSSGNLGLGVTPSAWGSNFRSLDVLSFGASVASSAAGNTLTSVAHNAYNDNTNWIYRASSIGAARYEMTGANGGSTHAWFVSAGGTAGNAISFTQAMTLDASGRLLIGYTGNTDGSALQIDANSVGATVYTAAFNNSNTSTSAYNTARWQQGAAGSAVGYVGTGGSTVGNAAFQNTFVVGTQTSNALVFNTADTERARITSGGYFKASNSGTYAGSTATYHEFSQSADDSCLVLAPTNASFTSSGLFISASRAANAAYYMIRARANAVDQFYVTGAGVIYAQNTTIQSLSDARLKENVRNAVDGLNVVNALRPVRYDWKPGYGNDRKDQLGFIAQEVEAVFPEAVSEWATQEGEDAYKTVGPGALIPVLVKAIQEQQALITALTARVAALEAQP